MSNDPTVWLISDHHFGHTNSLKFISSDGLRMRREFDEDDVEGMNETMVKNHNSVVGKHDKVYFCGDVAFNNHAFHNVMPRLNGVKRLILGNHDRFKMTEYMKYFQKIGESWQPIRGLVVSHRPLLLGKTDAGLRANIHGHIHRAHIDDSRYYNVSVEVQYYTPVWMPTVLEELRERGINV